MTSPVAKEGDTIAYSRPVHSSLFGTFPEREIVEGKVWMILQSGMIVVFDYDSDNGRTVVHPEQVVA